MPNIAKRDNERHARSAIPSRLPRYMHIFTKIYCVFYDVYIAYSTIL